MTALNTPRKSFISLNFLGYLGLILFGFAALGGLQYHYWYGESGYHELANLKKEVAKQQKVNAEQERLNTVLMADIADLKSGLGAVEEHARLNFGFIKKSETFVQVATTTPSTPDETQIIIGTDATPATETVVEVFDETPKTSTQGTP